MLRSWQFELKVPLGVGVRFRVSEVLSGSGAVGQLFRASANTLFTFTIRSVLALAVGGSALVKFELEKKDKLRRRPATRNKIVERISLL